MPVYQPFAPSVPSTKLAITGAVGSITLYAQVVVVSFPALSEPVSKTLFSPTLAVSAAADTEPDAAPDVVSDTVAETSATASPKTKRGAGEAQSTVGGVASRLITTSTGPAEPPPL